MKAAIFLMSAVLSFVMLFIIISLVKAMPFLVWLTVMLILVRVAMGRTR